MGANAQTSVPAFTAGQVLTAAQMTQVNTGIPVFASSTERDAAFGGTGEKTLAEGQMAYLEDTNATQYYDGSSWTELGATAGLTLVTSAAFSGVTSVSVDNCFTSTYRNYRIIWDTQISGTDGVYIRMRASSSDDSGTNYDAQRIFAFSSTIGASRDSNLTFWYLAPQGDNTRPAPTVMDILNPQVAAHTNGVFHGYYDSDIRMVQSTFYSDVTTQFAGFTFYTSGSDTMSGNYFVYGYEGT